MQRLLGLVTAVAMLVSAGCHAQPTDTARAAVPQDWKTECVGRYQVSVPGEVEVALTIPEKLFKPHDVVNEYHFSDGAIAPYSHLVTDAGAMYVTPSLNARVFENLKIAIAQQRLSRKKELIDEGDKTESESMQIYDTALRDTYLWVAKLGATIFMQRDGRIYQQSGGVENQTGKQFAKSFLDHFRPRALFDLPKQPGVCFPYGFIADDGKASRDIAVTMRLKNHPDVEVFFHDKSGDLSSDSNEPKDNIEYFWTKMYRDFAKLLEADSRKYYKVKMGEQDGTAMFITITRHDGSKDYGYIAIVKGDPTAATDTPSQMLYVIRTAKRAKGKPVSKDELKDIAERITASVKRRE